MGAVVLKKERGRYEKEHIGYQLVEQMEEEAQE